MPPDARTDWSVAVDLLTPEQIAQACRDEGFFELAVELTRRHARRLMGRESAKVVVLDDYRPKDVA